MVEMIKENLTQIDWHDSDALFKFSVDTISVARDYQEARKTFAISMKTLKIELAKAYQSRSIERRTSESKAYSILADHSTECREALMNLIDSEQQYKGLEKVLETRQAAVSLAQSLIKNRIDNI